MKSSKKENENNDSSEDDQQEEKQQEEDNQEEDDQEEEEGNISQGRVEKVTGAHLWSRMNFQYFRCEWVGTDKKGKPWLGAREYPRAVKSNQTVQKGEQNDMEK